MTNKLTKEELESITQAMAKGVKEGMSWSDRVCLVLLLLLAMFFPGYVTARLFVAAARHEFNPSVYKLFRVLAQSEYES